MCRRTTECFSEFIAEGVTSPRHYWGTINCDGINANGELCGVTTTSGLAWKIPGRVGDPPFSGRGSMWTEASALPARRATGRANLVNLSSFLAVEMMRQGKHPKDACLEALKRIRANTIEKRLRKPNGDPSFNISSTR